MLFSNESFLTHIARKRTIIRMYSHVEIQVVLPSEYLITDIAWEDLAFFGCRVMDVLMGMQMRLAFERFETCPTMEGTFVRMQSSVVVQ